jgi:hypothetical protein
MDLARTNGQTVKRTQTASMTIVCLKDSSIPSPKIILTDTEGQRGLKEQWLLIECSSPYHTLILGT